MNWNLELKIKSLGHDDFRGLAEFFFSFLSFFGNSC